MARRRPNSSTDEHDAFQKALALFGDQELLELKEAC
jgi:hypothetical protein